MLLLRRGASAPELLHGEGMAVGLDEGGVFDELLEERQVTLVEGDLVALYTDGVTEARNPNGEEFTRDRLAGALLRHEDKSLSEMARTVDRFVRRFAALAPRHDDSTLLLFRIR
jgi:sigma-B regulation protein RsbU (phosphoserine phosphatase)